MKDLAPITFDLESCLDLEEDYIHILNNAYLALFHNSEKTRTKATKTLASLFGKKDFLITHIYASYHDIFLRANYGGDAVVFRVGYKPDNYHGKPTKVRNVYHVSN